MGNLVDCIRKASGSISAQDRTYLMLRVGTAPDADLIEGRLSELRAELEALENDDVPGGSTSVERSGEAGPASEPVGEEVVPTDPVSAGQSASEPSGEPDEPGALDRGDTVAPESPPAASREQGNNKIFGKDGLPEPSERTARSDDPDGSLAASKQGAPIEFDGTERTEETDLRSALDKQRDADTNLKSVKRGSRANVLAALPNLKPEQADDVIKAETRLFTAENKGKGFLLTNGTGTGKTFSGLGLVKRYIQDGKPNILIVTPNDTISSEWQSTAAKFFDIQLGRLDSTADRGDGPSITQYANFYQNMSLYKRSFDLVVYDESHKLKGGQGRNDSQYTEQHLALTRHPDWLRRNAYNTLSDEFNLLKAEQQAYADEFDSPDEEVRKAAAEEAFADRRQTLDENATQLAEQLKGEPRPEVLFLSATPFASDQSIDYAEGYLFDYGDKQSEGYNSGGARERFFMSNFGYRMRYNKLTQPESEVDSALLQQQFHEKIKSTGALSGRALEMDADYSRDFVLPQRPSQLGATIDEGMDYIRGFGRGADGNMEFIEDEGEKYPDLAQVVKKAWDYHYMNALLEGLNTQDAIDRTRRHLALGRKVVVFHRYKSREPQHPFRMLSELETTFDIKADLDRFKKNRPDLWNLDMGELVHPLEAFEQAFGEEVAFHNGDVRQKDRKANLRDFNDDNGKLKVKVVQIQAGKEGVSWHDTTGKHPRALISIGLPIQSTDTTQMEGRTYRMGNRSDAMFEYIKQGLSFEERAFAQAIAQRSSTVENFAMGEQARNLMDAFIDGYQGARSLAPSDKQGKGGKKGDRQRNTMSTWDKARTYYFQRAKKNSRTKAREGVDYFATPEPIGLKMVEWASVKPNDRVLEPSAGHGAIARWFPATSKVSVVEPSPELEGQLLMNVAGANLREGTFEDLHISNKFEAIVMNPPFGRAGSTALPHIKKAAGHLANGGRIVAVYPEGSAMNKLEAWLESDESKGIYPVAKIDMPSAMFERAGTSVRTKIIVLDKQANPNDVPAAVKRDLAGVDNIKELFERIEGMTVPPRQEPSEPARVEVSKGVRVPSQAPAEAGANVNSRKVVDIDTYTHTKTGEELGRIVPKQHLGEHFKQANKIAKERGGYWSRYAKGFLFPDQAAAVEAGNAIEGALGWQLQVRMVGAGTGNPIGQVRAQRLVDEHTARWEGGPTVTVINNELELPLDLQSSIEPEMMGKIRGARQGDRVYLLAGNSYTDNDLLTTLAHEAVGHFAMEQLPDFQDAIDTVLENNGQDAVIERLTAKVHNLYPHSLSDPHLMAREVIASLAERPQPHPMLARLRGAVRRALRALGFRVRPGTPELQAMIARAARSLQEPTGWTDPRVKPDFRITEEPGESFDYVPDLENWREKIDRVVFDRFQRLKKVQKAITSEGRTITDLEDAFAAEQQMSGKVELEFEQFRRDYYEPLVELMREEGLTLDELDLYLYARHAPERNAQIAKVNPELPDGGSGMTTEEAVQVLTKARDEGKLAALGAAGALVDKITEYNRGRIVDAGLETQETIDHWTGANGDPDALAYNYYVPLRGFAEPKKGLEQGPLSGRGGSLGVRGRESMRALGRRSLAESPLGNLLEQSQRTVMRANKAEVGRHVLRLAEAHPNPGLWKIWKPGETPMVRYFDKKSKEVRYRPGTTEFQDARFFPVKAEGKQYYVEIFDKRLAESLHNLGPTEMGLFLRSSAKVTRYLSMINTQLNPDFIPVNFVRDIQSAIAHTTIDSRTKGSKLEGKRIAFQVARDAVPAMHGIFNGFKDMDNPGEWAQFYKEFREQGGKVGFFGQIDLKQDALRLDKDIQKLDLRNAAPRAFRSMLKYMDRLNTAIENAARLSLYVNAVRSGVSRKQAAVMAKNLTVNFNRHGEWGPGINAAYMFFNAAAQGSSAILTRFVKSRTSQVLAATLAASSYAMTEFLRTIMGDDDDGRSKYDDIPDYIRERNFIIPESFGITKDGYWTIPMPYGYNWFAVLGMGASDYQHGRPPSEIGNMVAGSFIAAFNPLGLEVSGEIGGTVGKMLVPSPIKPFVEVGVNENWFGAPVYPDYSFSLNSDSRKKYRRNPEAYQVVAEFLNDTVGGGGDHIKASPEMLDISPETMQQVFEFYTGGAGRSIERTVGLVNKMVQGEEIDPTRDIPVVRRFLSELDGRNDESDFYTRREKIERINKEFRGAKGDDKRELRKRYRAELKLVDNVKTTNKLLKRWRKQEDAATTEADKKKLQEKRDRQIDKFNSAYDAAMN